MAQLTDLLRHRLIGCLPVVNADLLKRKTAQRGWIDDHWIFVAGLTGGEKYRAVVQYSGKPSLGSAVILEPGEIYDFRRPFSLQCSTFFHTMLSCCVAPFTPATRFQLVLEIRPDVMGMHTPEVAAWIAGASVVREGMNGFDETYPFEFELGGKHQSRAKGSLHAHHLGGDDARWSNPWDRSKIVVELSSLSGQALADALTEFLCRMAPRYRQAALDQPWCFRDCWRLSSALHLFHRNGDELLVTDQGFELVNQPPPYWLRLPHRSSFEVNSGAWTRMKKIPAERQFKWLHAERGSNGQPSIVGIWE
jgi:hypothetical protein